MVLLEHAGNYCFTETEREGEASQGRKGQGGRGRGEKGKREEVNQFESPSSPIPRRAKDRSARLHLLQLRLRSHSLFAGRKARAKSRTCVRTEWRRCEISRRFFRGFHRPRMYTVSSRGERSPYPRKLTCAIKISSCVTGDAKETEGIGSER